MFIQRIKKIKTEKLIFLLAVLYRLPALGYDFINSDAFHWKERGYTFGSALMSFDFGGTAVTYHPGVPLLWSQFISNKLYSILDVIYYKGALIPQQEFFVNHFLQKFVLVIITSILIAWIYRVLKSITGKRASLIAVLLVLIEPFYLGLSRAVHTDVLLSLFMFLAFLYFYLSLSKAGRHSRRKGLKGYFLRNKNLILAGVFAGLAALTKSSGLFLVPFFFLMVLPYKLDVNRKQINGYFLVTGFAVLTFFVLWPAMWVQPITSMASYLFDGVQGVAIQAGHGHTWFGKETVDPGIAFYPVVLIARYSVIVLAAFILGVFYRFKNPKDSNVSFLNYSILFILIYLLMITFVAKKLDRYSLPLLFPMVSIGAYAFVKFVDIKKHIWWIVLFVVLRIALLYGLHPNYLAYYSPLVNGVEGGRYVVEPKWPVGYDKIAKFFNEKENAENIKVAVAEHDYLRPFAKFQVMNIRHEPEREIADYFVLPIYRPERNKFYTDNYDLEKRRDEITIAGVEYYKIYENHGKKN